MKKKREQTHNTYQTATGPIPYNMLNDYMFRVVLQKNGVVLRGLIGSLLHLDESEIQSVVITNPIKFGEQISNKTFILDIYLCLNDNTNINLEMQVLNEGDWTERSLSYLCRTYDQLYHGEDYTDACCAIQIGILDFDLFPGMPEFYASYRMMNVRNHQVYSEKLQLYVLELNHTELATEEDCRYGIDQWAKLFQATTWEELRMVVEKNKYMSEAAAVLYESNADEIIREQCQARREYNLRRKRERKRMQELEAASREKDNVIAEQGSIIVEKDSVIAEQKHVLEEKDSVLAEQKQALFEKDSALAEQENALAEKDSALAEKDSALAEMQKMLAESQKENERLKAQLKENV